MRHRSSDLTAAAAPSPPESPEFHHLRPLYRRRAGSVCFVERRGRRRDGTRASPAENQCENGIRPAHTVCVVVLPAPPSLPRLPNVLWLFLFCC